MAKKDHVWKKDVLSWSLYDFANTIYSMNIVSLYLKRYIIEDLGKDDRYFDIPFSLSMLAVALLLPALGTISDYSAKKKTFVFLFTLTCCMAVGLMAYIPPAMFMVTIILFIVANFSYEAAQPFYNALLYSVADGARARFVSGVGVAMGYVGSVIGMLVVLPFVTGSVFSLNIPFLSAGGKVAAFLPTAILFMLFSIPLFLWVKEVKIRKQGEISFFKSYRSVWKSIVATKKYPGVLRFLIADYFFEDTVTTVILNIGIYCAVVIGLKETDITRFLIVSTVSAIAGSMLLGKVAEKWSLKNLLTIIIWGWFVALILFVFIDHIFIIWILGSLIGILLGGLWTTTRPFLAELVPREELGQFFGLFSISGRAAAVIGPLIWTTVVYYFNADRFMGKLMVGWFHINQQNFLKLPYKMGVLSLSIVLLIGLFIFRKVPHTHLPTNESAVAKGKLDD
ncbi:MAG: MFS transporter [FCB group bacterium]|nr:MFS transporter [FCB group bacterium]